MTVLQISLMQLCKALKGLEEDEVLSGMRKTDRFTPVITAVVYYGEKPWDGATTLHGMLDIPEEMRSYINDYKMILVEARENSLVFNNGNNIDFFNLLEILLERNVPRNEAREKAIQYSEEHGTDKVVVMTIAGATNSKIDYNSFEKGDGRMCTLFEEIAVENEKKGKAEGKAEGIIETGLDVGLSEQDILERLQKKLDISLQKAQEYFMQFGKQMV